MFHWSIYTTYDATRFTLAVPLHYMMLLASIPGVLIALFFGWKAGHTWRNTLLVVAVLFGYSLFTSCSELILDKSTGKATLREFVFFHWSSSTYALSDIDRLFVASGNQNDQIKMQFRNGKVRSISDRDQSGGKYEAVNAANAFLDVVNRDAN